MEISQLILPFGNFIIKGTIHPFARPLNTNHEEFRDRKTTP